MQSHTIPTHSSLNIHLGPCLDQHPARGVVAMRGSYMERGAPVLRGCVGGLWTGRGGWWKQGNVGEESDWGSHGLPMDNLRICDGMGAAHANRLQGLAISMSLKVINLKVIAMHAIRCSCYRRLGILFDRPPDTSGWLGDAPLPRIRYCQRHMSIPRRPMSDWSPNSVTLHMLLCHCQISPKPCYPS